MFNSRESDVVNAVEEQVEGDAPKEETPKEDANKLDIPPGYQVIIPSPSKRMELLRAKEEQASTKPSAVIKTKDKKASSYHNEMTGADQEKIAEYMWPEKPTEWSTVQDSENPDEKIVNGQKVTRPLECHRVEVDGELTDTWALKGNIVTNGRCGTGEERDAARYGQLGSFSEGDFLLVPDGKRNQLYDGGWFTGVEKELPKPYGRSLLLEWADTSNYGGSKLDRDAWRPVFVPVSRLIHAPLRKRSFERTTKKRGSKNKFTYAIISKMTLGSEVVYKDNAPYCLFARNPREWSIWVRPISGGETLHGDDDDLCCFYLEDLDAYTVFTTKMAQQMKALMQKLFTAKQRKERRIQKEHEKTSVDPRLTGALTAASFTSSPAVSEYGSTQPFATGAVSSTPIGLATPVSLASSGIQNLAPLLQATAAASFGPYGMARSEPFTETEFWKNEANSFLADSKLTYQGLAKVQHQVEQSIQTLCDLSDHVRAGVKSQIELMKKNQELADRSGLTVSQLTALSQGVAKYLGGKLQTTAVPKTNAPHELPDTSAFLGKTATEILTAGTSMSYRTTLYGLEGLGSVVGSPNVSKYESPKTTSNGIEETKVTQTVEPKTPKLRTVMSSDSTPASTKTKGKSITPSPDSEVVGVQKTTYKPSRPKAPWSKIDQNSLFFKLDEEWIRSRRLACLRLGRPILPHEMGAVKWLGWRDPTFDAFMELKEPDEFSKILAMINYVEAKENGTGLDDKVVGNFVRGYKEGRSSVGTKVVSSSQSQKSSQFNKAQLKQLASSAVAPKKHKKKQEKSHKKRGMQKGSKRRAPDPKLKEVWPGIDTAANFNVSHKRIWRLNHIEAAKKTVANLKDRSRVQKLYRFVERMLKQMIDEKLCKDVADAADLKHATISLRNALRKISASGWQLQEEECKKYHFYWAAIEIYKDNYPTEWPLGVQRETAQLKVAEKVAGIAKSWEVLEAEPPAKKFKTEQSAPIPVDMSIADEDTRTKATTTPEVNLQVVQPPEEVQPEPEIKVPTPEPSPERMVIDQHPSELIIAAGEDEDDDFVPNHSPSREQQNNSGLEEEEDKIDTGEEVEKEPKVDDSLLLLMQDDEDDLGEQMEEEQREKGEDEEDDEEESDDDSSIPGAEIPTDKSEDGSGDDGDVDE